MKLYRDDTGHWHRTKDDAKGSGRAFEPWEVPVDQAGLLAFLNKEQDEADCRQYTARVMSPVPEPAVSQFNEVVVSYVEPETNITVADLTTVGAPHKIDSSNDVVEEILGSSGQLFGTYLNATIDRLGELRVEGYDALTVLRKQVRSYPHRAATERGLGHLLLGDVS